jgi:hypothetical protein
MGTKEGVINALCCIFGANILDKVTKTANGSNNRNINNYTLYNVMLVVIINAMWPIVDGVLETMKSM